MSGPLVRSSYRAGRSTGRRSPPARQPASPGRSASPASWAGRQAGRLRGWGMRPGGPAHILTCMAKKSPARPRTRRRRREPPGRIKQIRMAAGMVREANPKALPIVALAGLGMLAIVVVLGVVLNMTFLIPLGVLLGLLVAMILFGRFAQSAQYSAIEGQPGAAAAVLQTMRGNWTVTPAIAANRNMDVVHRAVGRPGRRPGRRGLAQQAAEPAGRREEAGRPGRLRHPDLRHPGRRRRGSDPDPPPAAAHHEAAAQPRARAVSDLNYRLKALPQSLQSPRARCPGPAGSPRRPGRRPLSLAARPPAAGGQLHVEPGHRSG